ncbi:glycosyltransferase family 2 protein [Brevibacillus sp. NRS-1366]|uniref:glycosyltransferase family 2 protein n=1 Tax=Brevibacillus sp. NRS-1366 TaxID=3233899 RepID=UPI003D23A943
MLSLAMIVKNEAEKIGRCLESVKSLVDEIVIVDTGSTDNTKEIAMSFGARIFDYQWNNSFADARNFSLQHCKGEWRLVLDADEYLIRVSKDDLEEFLSNENVVGRIKIINCFRQDGEDKESQAFVSRLIPKGAYFEGRIHEQVNLNLPRKNAPIEVFHDGYYQSDKTNRNVQLLQLALRENPKDHYLLYQIGKEFRLQKDFKKALNYFEKSYKTTTLKDRYRTQLIVEFLYACIGGNNFKKGLEIIESESNMLKSLPDFHFVCGLFYMELVLSDIQKYLEYLPLVENSYLKCLEVGDSDKYDSVLGTGSFLAAYNLAVYYETTGIIERARYYYEVSSKYNYGPAILRHGKLG